VLYFGDNLPILRDFLPEGLVDLVYLDPPFNSNATYNLLFRERGGERSAAQITAFEDTWRWGTEAEATYRDVVGGDTPKRVADLLVGLRTVLGSSDMMAYITMMTPRLLHLHRVLKPHGSIYLHCDPTASHYLKLVMDSVFGPEQFRNEIIWRRSGSHNSSRRFGPIHDVLLFYTKTDNYYFNPIYKPYFKGHVAGYFKQRDQRGAFWTNALTGAGTRNGDSGKPWHGYSPTAVGRHWAIPGRIAEELGLDPDLALHEKLDALDAAGFITHPGKASNAMPTYKQYLNDSPGNLVQDIWAYQPYTHNLLHGTDDAIDEDVRWLVAQGDSERMGYPTQKPLGLLRRIIESSCPPDGVVLDPFCGCGTAVVAAELLGRSWIGNRRHALSYHPDSKPPQGFISRRSSSIYGRGRPAGCVECCSSRGTRSAQVRVVGIGPSQCTPGQRSKAWSGSRS
jgi:site-specific DNA-methyltransferase (adenine-specific)